ncbi:MAG: ligase-associated DNA damage response endonuclease PdeM [Phenylobacterium sp.]|nr:ligase-associated DNA damage response endonuclease PdeM [Phenylobacterium sp.]MCA6244722.1 ligase-associated DNA damage response endonuclease PdeM [Phenylobacterium sp.]MCA6276995.1 ligase-associated DNA damage response endonuclease PdeM [Phenylobacterium sp.]MCA6294991.1 ligase-associated DNA damage response endonuclease PdeM [Phenylobacterium sp.]MCA6328761.1 ligase-associated DNA damage response endonuclease PdeM [Phenylobacterium sp.]
MRPAADGALELVLAGEAARLLPSGALLLSAWSTLIVADLHLEKGSAFARRGQLLPPLDTRETLRRLAVDAAAVAPERILFLGDAFHDREASRRMSEADRQALEALGRRADLVWITGNHDPQPDGDLPGEAADEVRLGALVLRHEPLPAPAPGEIAGHLHPCARIATPRGAVRRRCLVTDGERAILPAYGAFTGGLNVLDPAFSGLFRKSPVVAALGAQRVHAAGIRSLRPDRG